MATRQIAAAYADTKYYSHRVSLHLSIKELQHFHSKSQTKRKKIVFAMKTLRNRIAHHILIDKTSQSLSMVSRNKLEAARLLV